MSGFIIVLTILENKVITFKLIEKIICIDLCNNYDVNIFTMYFDKSQTLTSIIILNYIQLEILYITIRVLMS